MFNFIVKGLRDKRLFCNQMNFVVDHPGNHSSVSPVTASLSADSLLPLWASGAPSCSGGTLSELAEVSV